MNTLDVEADVVTGETLLELLVVHLDGLHLSGDVRGSERDDHAGLDDTSLDTTDGHRANTTDLVDILEGKTEGLVGGTDRGLDGVDGVEPLRAEREVESEWHVRDEWDVRHVGA